MSLNWRRLAALGAGLLALPVLMLFAAFMLELAFDASAWRELAQRHASAALGRPVLLQGAMELQLRRDLGLGLRMGQLRIQSAPGFGQTDLLTLADARAELDLGQALHGRLQLGRIEASDARLRLERSADGRDNWASDSARDPARPPAELDIGQFTLHGLSLHYQDFASAQQFALALDELTGSAPAGQPLQLALRGHASAPFSREHGPAQAPFSISLEGGPLPLLLAGAPQWPFKLDGKFDGATLRTQGHFDQQAPRTINLTELSVRLGETELAGQMTLALDSARPQLSATLNFATLDLRPWLPSGEAGSVTGTERAAQPFALRRLVPAGVDLKLDLGVERWLGLPVEIRAAGIALRSDGQTAGLTFQADAAGIPLAGRLDLDTRPASPSIALQVGAADLALGPLLQQLDQGETSPDLQGQLGRLDLRLAGSGETLEAMLTELELSLDAAAAQVSMARRDGSSAARPITFALDRLTLGARRGERLHGQASGSWLGQQAMLSLRAGSLAQLWRELASPLELELKLKPSKMSLRLDGLLNLRAWRETALNFALQAPSSGALAPYLGVAPSSKLPVNFSGQLQLSDTALRLSQSTLMVGRSELHLDGWLSRTAAGPASKATLQSPLIDVAELSSLRPSPSPRASNRRDPPLFASALDLPDADLDLSLQRVVLDRADLADLRDLHLQARLRDGRVLASALGVKVAGQALQGLVELDPRAEQVSAKLELSSGPIDIGALLRGLGAAEAINGTAEAVKINLSGQGQSVREFLSQAELDARISGGSVSLLGAGRRPVTDIEVDKAFIHAAAGQPLWLELEGRVDQTPLKLGLRVGTLAGFTQVDERLPFWLEAQGAGTLLQLEGRVALPLGREGDLTFEISGDRLDSLTPLTRVNLPPWGPWRLRGPVRMTADGYELEQLRLRVGESQLGGSGRIDLSGPRPRLDARLSGRSVQLADFPTPELTPEQTDARREDRAAAELSGNAIVSLRSKVSRLARRTEGLLSAGFLRRFDANIDVVAREVFSGSDRLADGELHLQLKDGRLRLDPAFVNLPGGGMRLTATFDPTGEQIEFEAKAAIERFDYGIIARRMGREGNVQGLFSMNLDLAGQAPTLDTVLRNANGRVDVAVWPTNLRADVFNLWSVNLVLNLIPLFDPGGQPQVNCVVARFDLKDGKLTEDNLTIDTTRVRVRGSGFANLATDELSFVFRPRAKGFALFRLQTPLRVSGTLNNQRIGIQRGDLIGSTMRSILSPIWLPIERLMLGPNPPDGADICTDPLSGRGP
ncbi:AsmA family protein [Paucibacter sp. B2R-40]|uniref:AsmA family protein n=1 Tax=Paucibacter sp. B2R-40 TaxID=2893554 RepID=UPI0021E474DF|nr:AsmA family protein [Paucibacter sp. B2R-40]MCV2353337.1 AsmA family protein [Paucibacter sp. B2R-40]